MNSVADVWTNVLQQLKKDLSETTITTWFDELTAVDIRENTFYLHCPNDFNCLLYTSNEEQGRDHIGQHADVLGLAGEELDHRVGDQAEADGVADRAGAVSYTHLGLSNSCSQGKTKKGTFWLHNLKKS